MTAPASSPSNPQRPVSVPQVPSLLTSAPRLDLLGHRSESHRSNVRPSRAPTQDLNVKGEQCVLPNNQRMSSDLEHARPEFGSAQKPKAQQVSSGAGSCKRRGLPGERSQGLAREWPTPWLLTAQPRAISSESISCVTVSGLKHFSEFPVSSC